MALRDRCDEEIGNPESLSTATEIGSDPAGFRAAVEVEGKEDQPSEEVQRLFRGLGSHDRCSKKHLRCCRRCDRHDLPRFLERRRPRDGGRDPPEKIDDEGRVA